MPMTEAEYYQAIARLPKTSAGLEEKLRLLEQVVWDEAEPKAEIEKGEQNVQYRKRTTRVENYYYGVEDVFLQLWIDLRKNGIVLGNGWLFDRAGNHYAVRTVFAAPPIDPVSMPENYDGKRGDGLW